MDMNASSKIRKQLEDLYDIPFDVDGGYHYKDPWFHVKPHNSEESLFDIDIKFKNQLRLVVEVTPERYAAFSINYMASAAEAQKKRFAEYAKRLGALKARTEFSVNDSIYNPEEPETWPETWNNYRMRVSRSPIISEDETFDEAKIAAEWATIVTGMFLSLLNVTQKEDTEYLEGGLSRVEVNKYERNPVNRKLCLSANGFICKICGFDFEKKYGKIGHHFIHVHHIVPVSESDTAYVIDPVKDLIPVCPNCHAMLHQSDPPYMPEDLKRIIAEVVAGNETGGL